MSDPVNVAGGSAPFVNLKLPEARAVVQAQRDYLTHQTPLDGALLGAGVSAMYTTTFAVSRALGISEGMFGTLRSESPVIAAMLVAGSAAGALGATLKSTFMANGSDVIGATTGGHLIAGLGVGAAFAGAALIAPSGPIRGALVAGAIAAVGIGALHAGAAGVIANYQNPSPT